MFYRHKRLGAQTIVITGATSGIGLATATLAARRGANLVLAARSVDGLDDVAAKLGRSDRVITVQADVGIRADVERIASRAIEAFGGFDTWVNNAGQTIYGRLEEVSEEDLRALMEVNFWGAVNGSLVAVSHLKRRGGALINIGSIGSDFAFPLQGMYSASKHAIRGFTDALRMELEQEGAPVSVTLIKPASIDTPLPQRARNYMDREPDLPPPVYRPREVAEAILSAAASNRRDVYVGGGGKAISVMAALAPRLFDLTAPPRDRGVRKAQRTSAPPGRHSARGNARRRRARHPSGLRQSLQRLYAPAQPSRTALHRNGHAEPGARRLCAAAFALSPREVAGSKREASLRCGGILSGSRFVRLKSR